ncbi:hypothetical protein EDD84_26985 [Burkholderia gladioli]|nr:hypothetical protein EDD84_26985 [Burkholderia gladioli]
MAGTGFASSGNGRHAADSFETGRGAPAGGGAGPGMCGSILRGRLRCGNRPAREAAPAADVADAADADGAAETTGTARTARQSPVYHRTIPHPP